MATSTAPHKLSTRGLVLRGVIAGAAAAAVVVLVASIGGSAGVSFAVSGESIPMPAFVFWILVGTAIGVVLALLIRDRRRFTIVTMIGAACTLVPPILLPDDVGTKAILVATHILAAAIIIPILRWPLPAASTTRIGGAA